MKLKLLLYFIQPIILLTVYSQQINGQNNPCGVKAIIAPGGDSIVTSPTVVFFSSASINATSYKFIIDRTPFSPNTPVNYGIPTGITEVKLVAYNGNCTDTAVAYYLYTGDFPTDTNNTKIYYGRPATNEYLANFIPVSTGGFLIAGDRNNNSFLNLPQRGFLIKTKTTGCIEWAVQMEASANYHVTKIDKICEAFDRSFFITGTAESNAHFIMKLSAAGVVLWSKKLNIPTTFAALNVTGVSAMPDGGLVIAAAVWGERLYVARLDANANIVWQKEYTYISTIFSPWMRTILLKDGAIYISGSISYSQNGSGVSNALLMKLDYASGQTKWTKHYSAPQGEIQLGDIHDEDTCILMNAITGTGVTGSYNITSFIKVDTSGAVVRSAALAGSWEYYAGNSWIVPLPGKKYYVLSSGFQPLPLQPYISNQTKIAKLDSAYNVIWSKHHAAVNLGTYFVPAIDADETFVMAGNETGNLYSYYSSLSAKIVIRKIDSSGNEPYTSCNLYDQPMTTMMLIINTTSFNWVTDVFTNYSTTTQPIPVSNIYPELRYKCPDYIDSCSLFKLAGPRSLCNLSNTYTYKVHKNKGCGQPTQWRIPSSLNIIQQTDSSVTIKFPAYGSYVIAGELTFGCSPLKDSIIVVVGANTPILNIGPDTSLCPNNRTLLRAGSRFFSYQWQDGSTDSLFTVISPGQYWVIVNDSCGNILRDTINITLANAVPISIGPDRAKCNNDTLHLQASAGFLNYTWSPHYNINVTNSQQVIVFPAVDTTYILIAEKTPGCFAYDTVRVTVHQSAPIYLGTDKSFCFGDSLLLDAGSSFRQYQWSNGSTTQHITVHDAGVYSIIGTSAEGCKSSDTLIVSNIYSLPIVALNQSPSLCIGDTRVLDAGPGYASYSWNTGGNSQSIIVSNIGQYSVLVIDKNGCKGGDTTMISQMLALPSGFLGPDTAICSYGDLQLKTTTGFNQYTWSNGSLSSSIIIKQPGLYWLRVKDVNGCFGKDSILVNQKECLKGFFMPTGFTPNTDGKNDLLKPVLLGDVVQYRFWIYNRWGELVFETTDVNRGWNGMYKGLPQNSGVFVWMCKYQFEGETLKQEKGTAVLIR